MAKRPTLDIFERIELPDPTDLVLEQIHRLIQRGDLGPGARLPSDKRLEEKMGLSRGFITKAMKRLETYGIVYTVPQSGTYISNYKNEVLDGLVSNVIKLDGKDFSSLTDLRSVLEQKALSGIIDRVDEEAIKDIEAAHIILVRHLEKGDAHYDHDILFHLSILRYCGNPVLQSLITQLCVQTLEILKECEKELGYSFVKERLRHAADEHQIIVDGIRKMDKSLSVNALKNHFNLSKDYLSKNTTRI